MRSSFKDDGSWDWVKRSVAEVLKLAKWEKSVSDPTLGSPFDPWGDSPLGELHNAIARTYGIQRAFISTNGTTMANVVALLMLVQPGDTIVVERDVHVSIVGALIHSGAEPVYFKPQFDEDLGINLAATPSDLRAVLEDCRQNGRSAKAVVITSPKYFGVVGDIGECVQVCREYRAAVLVDEAHGACFRFHPELPTSATEVGATIVNHSTHKTASALSQGSLLLLCDPLYEGRMLDVINSCALVSTSFSYQILASVGIAIAQLAEKGHALLERALRTAEWARDEIRRIPGLHCFGIEQAGRSAFRELDPLRLTIDVSDIGLTGLDVARRLLKEYRIVAELGDLRNLLLLTTFGHSESDLEHICTVLREIVRNPGAGVAMGNPTLPQHPDVPPLMITPREAFYRLPKASRVVQVHEAISCVSGETIACYPPGNAAIVAGEIVTEEVVRYLCSVASAGGYLKGASDHAFKVIRIIDMVGGAHAH